MNEFKSLPLSSLTSGGCPEFSRRGQTDPTGQSRTAQTFSHRDKNTTIQTHTHKNIICKIILLSSEYSECIEDEMFSLRKKIFLKQKLLKHRNSVTQNTFSILSKLNNPNKLLSECAFYFQEQKFIWFYMTQNIVLQTIKYSVVALVVSRS